jgi:hypothetical protein
MPTTVLRRVRIIIANSLGKIPSPSRNLWFTEGFDTTDLQEAKALLDALV